MVRKFRSKTSVLKMSKKEAPFTYSRYEVRFWSGFSKSFTPHKPTCAMDRWPLGTIAGSKVENINFRPTAPSREVHCKHTIENVKSTFLNCKIILKNWEAQSEKMNQKTEWSQEWNQSYSKNEDTSNQINISIITSHIMNKCSAN